MSSINKLSNCMVKGKSELAESILSNIARKNRKYKVSVTIIQYVWSIWNFGKKNTRFD